jgi:YesN/AraC family two-component response regulator
MSSNQIRVLCVDDHPLVLEGIIRKIDLQADMKVIAAVTTGEEALEVYSTTRPDVA